MRVVAHRVLSLSRLAALVLATGLLLACADADRPKGRFVGGAPPAFATADTTWVNSEPMTWSDLRGQVVLVEFGYLDCPACQKMAPHLSAWHRVYSKKGLTVLYVEEGRATSLSFLQERIASDGLPYPILHDGVGATAHTFGVKAYPVAFVVNRAGKVVWEGVPIRNPAAVEIAIQGALAN